MAVHRPIGKVVEEEALKPVALKLFKNLYSSSSQSDLLLMPDMSIEQAENHDGFKGYAHMYEGHWLCLWADAESVFLTHNGQSIDFTGCRGKFRLSFRNLFDWLHRKFVLVRGGEVIAQFDTSMDIDAFIDITYDGIDFEADNFFAWLQQILNMEDALAFMQADKPFKVHSDTR
ncbi:MAG: hypothetical protein JKY60_02400 [Kordiimonadaceae bacterium]|nr:hypothetical protein [Kordiimonadaceae bacterium]